MIQERGRSTAQVSRNHLTPETRAISVTVRVGRLDEEHVPSLITELEPIEYCLDEIAGDSMCGPLQRLGRNAVVHGVLRGAHSPLS